MGAIEFKNNILEIIKNADEQLLNVVKTVIDNYQEDASGVYSIDGNPMSRTQYKTELKNAFEEIRRGEYVSQESLENESNSW